ncbi:rod-binding protein [Xaviernesmea oryzae]|uniref:Rod-binding protein n=1 Tax=Xaviernesmea oryzae TaxID=464029 RepID=A0A1Q9ARV7_9HYPH|nr:rod-binding protein [Xaviernesmea oryzae]OLP58157.1 rod-binding protein [Xaviernesmea oryzae]SEL80661.1 Rod binding protein [Xaviernesmea oryzae]
MAISPPSDLVLDVVRAADPAQVQEAQTRLRANRAAFRATSLAEAGNGFSSKLGMLDKSNAASLGNISNHVKAEKVPAHYRKFEGMVLQNFVQDMLPKESSEVFGKGTAGDVWKSMMAEQIANVIAKGNGVGIARSLMINREPATSEDAHQASIDTDTTTRASGMVQQVQRQTLAQLLGMKDDEMATTKSSLIDKAQTAARG